MPQCLMHLHPVNITNNVSLQICKVHETSIECNAATLRLQRHITPQLCLCLVQGLKCVCRYLYTHIKVCMWDQKLHGNLL